ncbi:hypothetical protein Ppb6_01294 [Photorhabdus australis subsp. thailandensis]|uniref:Uncharacterized protein n=2 Tax=Photorhabdus australis TaxID=286156 RepID=A0A1C0U6H9_9GAMM|nr:hypothetical protein Ppb6_01294 [Photorhabdus australis subsp. thailandensis]
MKKFFLFFMALFSLSTYGENTMDKVKYISYLETNMVLCRFKVNGITTLDNFSSISGTISTGYNIAPLLQNGKNILSLDMGPLSARDNKYVYKEKNAECKVRLVRVTPYDSDEITNIITKAAGKDGILKPNSTQSVNFNINTAQSSKITTQEYPNEFYYRTERTVTLNDLPVWAWTTSTPLPETAASTELVKKAYEDIWQIMKNRDLAALQSAAKLMLHEHAQANNSTEQSYFDSFDFKRDFDNGYQAIPIDWKKYKLIRYMDSRLFRFEVAHGSPSPLLIRDKDGKNGRTFSPFFSLINGKVVISR